MSVNKTNTAGIFQLSAFHRSCSHFQSVSKPDVRTVSWISSVMEFLPLCFRDHLYGTMGEGQRSCQVRWTGFTPAHHSVSECVSPFHLVLSVLSCPSTAIMARKYVAYLQNRHNKQWIVCYIKKVFPFFFWTRKKNLISLQAGHQILWLKTGNGSKIESRKTIEVKSHRHRGHTNISSHYL